MQLFFESGRTSMTVFFYSQEATMERILEILEQNARATADDIAKMIDSTPAEVEKAIRVYEKKGVIVKYKTVIDKELVAADELVSAVIEVKVAPQKDLGFDAVAEKIYRFPEVTSCYLLSGGHDLHLIVEGKTLREVASFVSQKLAPLDHVKSTATHFLLKKYKDDGVIMKKQQSKRLAISGV
jgi:DNA-binding Lrp family transcriptional regulator